MTTTETETAISSPTRTIKRKRGAPSGNENAIKHGVYRWSATGKLPAAMKYVRCELRKLRYELEAKLAAENGGAVTIVQHSLIADVVRHEGVARLIETWLAREANALRVADRVSLVRQLEFATDARTRAIRALGLEPSTCGSKGGSDSLFAHVPPIPSRTIDVESTGAAADATTTTPPASTPPPVSGQPE
jgi:hypothetical protein